MKIYYKELQDFINLKAHEADSKAVPGEIDPEYLNYLQVLVALERLESHDNNAFNTTRAYGICMPILIISFVLNAILNIYNILDFILYVSVSGILISLYIGWLKALKNK